MIHATAIISPEAELGSGVSVGPYSVIGPNVRIGENSQIGAHVVIKGENHHVLEALQFTHAGIVDCIYIDPPYNSRDKQWKYNNDYVDSDDDYRHSKWLAMMERRLKVLAERGVRNFSRRCSTLPEPR